jgi:hypothetical protein
MKVVVLQSNYIPWKGYFDLINHADVFCFYDEVQYTKNDWRNRNKIYTKNGVQWISIPIQKDAVKLKISEVLLPDNWQKEHSKILQFSYGKSPYFSQLKELMDDLYVTPFTYLSEFNQSAIKKISAFIGISTKFDNSANYSLDGDKLDRLILLLTNLKATEYISGPSAKNYLNGNEYRFEEKGIQLTYKNYEGYLPYKQLSEPFEHAVSIFDMIANVEKSQLKNHIFIKQ